MNGKKGKGRMEPENRIPEEEYWLNQRKPDNRMNEEHHHHGGRHHHKRKSGWKKVLAIVLVVILLVLAAAAAGAYFYFKTGLYGKSNYVKNTGYTVAESIEQETYVDEEGKIQVMTEATLDQKEENDVVAKHEEALKNLKDQIAKPTGTYNLLLIGVDRRDTSWSGNSDVMMLVTVNHDKKTIYMTSFLRDLYANIPEVGVRKLNASCAYGGAPLCVATIKQNYGVEIDNYAMVDFNAMADIVDALGGVDLEVSAEEAVFANNTAAGMIAASGKAYAWQDVDPAGGMVHMDGYHAVGYARNRYTGNTYDFGRTERQRKVLFAIFEKAKSGGLGSLSKAAESVLPYVTHDIDEVTLLKLISQVPSWLDYDVEQQHIPYDGEYYSQNEILIPTDMGATIAKLRETIY